jgi:hypothetical protein
MKTRVVNNLEDLRSVLVSLPVKEHLRCVVAAAVTQDQASKFAGSVNDDREGHVWVDVVDVAFMPEPTTQLDVRVSA